jgi:hypothetical protein
MSADKLGRETVMPRVQVELVNIYCKDTEDVTGADHFYLVGGVMAGDATNGVLTTPLSINDDQTKTFPGSERLLFDTEVPNEATLFIGLAAYDEDAGKTWEHHKEVVTQIADKISEYAHIGGPKVAIAGHIVQQSIRILGGIMSLDKDDLLGECKVAIPVADLKTSAEQKWHFYEGGAGWSTWDYVLTYRIDCTR